MYERFLEPIIEQFTTGEYYSEVCQAVEEYYRKAGKVNEDDLEYEQRMCIFMDWYLFDRDLPGVDLPPIKYFFRQRRKDFGNEELNIYKDLCETIHSIFRLKRFSWFGSSLIVLDLFNGKKYKVNNPEIIQGFSRGDVFEARLIPFKGAYEFSKGFCFHPLEVKPFIINEIKKVKHQERRQQNKLILELERMKLDHLHYQHRDIRKIYQFNP